MQKYYDAKYIPSLQGIYQNLGDVTYSLAKSGSYQWKLTTINTKRFIIRSDILMQSAGRTSVRAGCGFAFDITAGSINLAYLDHDGNAYLASGLLSYGTSADTSGYYQRTSNPVEFELVMIVYDKKVLFFINGKQIFEYGDVYVLDGVSDAKLGPAVISGSNKDYGERCEFKNVEVWIING